MEQASTTHDLGSLTYVSSASPGLMSRAELLALLTAIRPRNSARGISGLLLYSGGNIMQVLEGPAVEVTEVFDDIRRDPRHHDVTVLHHQTVSERAFADWSMGFRDVAAGSRSGLPLPGSTPGLNDVMTGGSLRARTLPTTDQSAVRLLQLFLQHMR